MRTALALVPLLLLAACSAGAAEEKVALSGKRVSKSFATAAFDTVSLEGPDDVVVRVGPVASVTAQGDSALVDRLRIAVEKGSLKIGRRGGGSGWAIFSRDRSDARQAVTIVVTVPALTAAVLAGSGDMRVDKAASGKFSAVVAGSGDLSIDSVRARETDAAVAGSGDLLLADVETDALEMAIAGSGNIDVRGRARRAELSIAGSGDIRAAALRSDTANVAVAGSGNIAVRAETSADISIVGSGDVDIHGPAACKTSKLGSGTVRCRAS